MDIKEELKKVLEKQLKTLEKGLVVALSRFWLIKAWGDNGLGWKRKSSYGQSGRNFMDCDCSAQERDNR